MSWRDLIGDAFEEPDSTLSHQYENGGLSHVDLWYCRPAVRELLAPAQLNSLLQQTNDRELCGVATGLLMFSYWGWQQGGKLEILLRFRPDGWNVNGFQVYAAADLSIIAVMLRQHESAMN